MAGKRPKNSELRLSRLEEEDPPREADHGILELFEPLEPPPDEDAPLQRDLGADYTVRPHE